ncbi:MAG TPA: TetR/AcrR family transcriptional regulator [Thermoanaerobaculia bacterium]|nr:TetR/AcrR family transcriptional regulator [Thermoanaerobaculia bacterium]
MTLRENHRERTKRQILDVALALFQEKGFRPTTMRDIADRAGIALGTTYNYFPTKEHLALYFFEAALERVLARHRREAPAEASLEEKVFLLIALELEEVEPYREFLNVIVTQAMVPTSPLHPYSLENQRLKNRHLEYVAELVREAIDRGELPALGYESMMLSAFWVFHLGMVMFWLNDESPHKEDTWVLLDKSLRFILGALRQESGAERNDAREADAV